jgi:hypothetical protein
MKNSTVEETQDLYLFPYIEMYDGLEDIEVSDESKRFVFNHEKMSVADPMILNKINRSFIISEPGYGKSRLLQKLAQERSPGQVLFKDLKSSIDNNAVLFEDLDDQISHLYLDGLDEVSSEQFPMVLNSIAALIKRSPALNICISCRTHYLIRWQYKLQDFAGFKYIVIQPFSEVHIRRYLEHFLMDEETVQTILHRSSGSSRDSVLKTPRYLEGLVRSITAGQWNIAELQTLSRVQIFEKVIYYQLRTETDKKKDAIGYQIKRRSAHADDGVTLILEHLRKHDIDYGGQNELLITQRVLEKLALIMEIYQRNRIRKDELITFLDETNSNVNQAFLQGFSVDKFIERTLKCVDFDYLEFENTEFQEYLAAKELIRMSNSEQVLYDLILEKNLQVILSNWFDVVQYAIEIDPNKVAGGLANYLAIQPQRQVEDRLIELLLGPGMEQAKDVVKKSVFTAVFTYFQHNAGHIYHKDTLLAALYHPDLESLLRLTPPQNSTPAEITRFVNSLLVTGKVCVRGLLSEQLRTNWLNYLMNCIEKPVKGITYEEIFYGLEALGANDELISLYPKLKTRSDQVLEWYLDSLGRIAPDQCVDIFIDILKKKPGVNSKERFFDDLTAIGPICQVIDVLLKNRSLITNLFNNRWSFISFYSLFDHIKAFHNEVLDHKIERLFFIIAGDEEYHYLSGTKKAFMERAVRYLISSCPGFVDRFLKSKSSSGMVRELSEAIAGVITSDQFAVLESWAKGSGIGYYDLHALISHLEKDGSYVRKPVIDTIKSQFPSLFKVEKITLSAMRQKEKEKIKNLYTQFRKLLKPNQNTFDGDVFKFYLKHYDELAPLIKPAEHTEIREIVRSVITKVQPETFRITVKNDKDRVNYQLNNSWWFNFGFFVRMALFLGETDILRSNREKIIKYLPLLRDYNGENIDVTSHVMDFLGALTTTDISILLAYCKDRDDDYLFSATTSFIDLIKDHRLISLLPFLQQIIGSEITTEYEKIKALKCYRDISDHQSADRDYLRHLFEQFVRDDQLKRQLGDLANEILIRTYKEAEAIKWRFDELKNRKILMADEPVRINGIRSYPEWEVELDKPQFGKCLYDNGDTGVQQQMFGLLEYGLTIRGLDRHNRYSEYLLVIVYEYFERNNDLKNIDKIKNILAKPEFRGTAIAFKTHMVKLEKQLSEVLARHETISDPIRIYNSIQTTRYLPVYNQKALSEVVNAAVMDMENFVINKGYAHTALQLSGDKTSKGTQLFNEDILQKTLSVALENSLLRKGIREVDIIREAQLSDDQRLDLLVKYGFIGPVMIELKLLHNPEIQNKEKRHAYLNKLIKYKKGIGADHALYLILKVRKNMPTDTVALTELNEEYQNTNGLEIRFIDCTQGFS